MGFECKDNLKELSLKLDSLMKTDLSVDAILKKMGIHGGDKDEERTALGEVSKSLKTAREPVMKTNGSDGIHVKKVAKDPSKRKSVDGKGASPSNKKKLVASDRAKATKEACKQILQQLPPTASELQPVPDNPETSAVKHAFDSGASYMTLTDDNACNWTQSNSSYYSWQDPSPSASYSLANSDGFVNFLSSNEDKLREERDLARQQLWEAQNMLQNLQEELQKKDRRIRELEAEVSKQQIVATPSKVKFLRTLANYFSGDVTDQTKSATISVPNRPSVAQPTRKSVSKTLFASPLAQPAPSGSNLPHQPLQCDQQTVTESCVTTQRTVDQEWCSPVTRSGERKEELVSGREVFITRAQKASLSIGGFSEARKVVIRIMDMLFDQQTLAGMSAVGSRQAYNSKVKQPTEAMPVEVRLAIQDFVDQNCPPEQSAACKKDFNSIINSKCGTARRYLTN